MDVGRLLRLWVVPTLMYSILYSISLFYGALFIVRFLYRWVRAPSVHFWKVKSREVPPKCLNDPALGNHAYVQLKYVKLHYVEAGDKTKPLMLMLHGFPEFWYSWRHQLKEFSKDHWVVAVDMRGYGDSEKPEGRSFYRLRYLVEDVKNLVEALGREECTLVAHDWGGVVAWYFLMIYPKMVSSYVIMGTPHPVVFRKMLIKSFSQFRKSWYIFFFQLPYLPELYMRISDLAQIKKYFATKKSPSPFSEEDVEAYKFTFGKPGALTPPINFYRATLAPDRGLLKRRATDFKMPRGLLIFGGEDPYMELEAVDKTRRMVYNLTTEVVPGAGHSVQQEVPDAVNNLMREFLKAGFEDQVKSE
ncbi:epoxide hydrolase 4-like [Macrosteles quadrilineatus]|uniref:epoxide hydrolase 4-like n=1 Tax=Macrosteles quadrilineatus TaxID=74068 RepID=UPI0023E2BBC5|nr:epoxide hydrolase 4-like [Macrosteles quadrilineatus]